VAADEEHDHASVTVQPEAISHVLSVQVGPAPLAQARLGAPSQAASPLAWQRVTVPVQAGARESLGGYPNVGMGDSGYVHVFLLKIPAHTYLHLYVTLCACILLKIPTYTYKLFCRYLRVCLGIFAFLNIYFAHIFHLEPCAV
jgi:hypothetical protein